jgi:hypothetical protein
MLYSNLYATGIGAKLTKNTIQLPNNWHQNASYGHHDTVKILGFCSRAGLLGGFP